MESRLALGVALGVALGGLGGCTSSAPKTGGPLDAGILDAGTLDASVADLAERPDAIAVDLISPPDFASAPLTHRYWKLVFVDDFKGKPDTSSRSTYCYDTLKPQCAIWTGGGTNDCDWPIDGGGHELVPPVRENFAAVLNMLDLSRNWNLESFPSVQARYSQLVTSRLAALDKCTWTLYQTLNWMGTDYAGHWSSRFDATQAQVHPEGRGYLELSAMRAPVSADCVFGGTPSGPGNVNCQVKGFAAGVLHVGTSYWVEPNPAYPGVYYAPVGGACPYGGTLGVNCFVYGFGPINLEPTGVSYWVDTNPSYPGVYYANSTRYACREYIDYTGGVHFRKLVCPTVNGGMQSADADPLGPTMEKHGHTQKYGRFEVKLKIPKGKGAFPAAWMMPMSGSWPYEGGEIDILEARDAANETYQTYHHGKCIASNYSSEALTYVDDSGATQPVSSSVCGHSGLHYNLTAYTSHNLSVGMTVGQRRNDEFNQRDHVFAAEWSADLIEFFVNNVKTNTIKVGTVPVYDNNPPIPAGMQGLQDHNFPTAPFYWILNHSTWVQPADAATFQPQSLFIDYVKNYVACETDVDLCPCGGRFVEGTGCVVDPGVALACPSAPAPSVTVVAGYSIYQSECRVADLSCASGGVPVGGDCRLLPLQPGQVVQGVTYWVDANPAYPGVYYAPVAGGCPYGGSVGVNCQVVGFAPGTLEEGVEYRVVAVPGVEGVYYTPDFRN